jgi:Zn-dependent protease with chaperone function
MDAPGPTLAAIYYDGVSARPRPVTLRVVQGQLRVSGEGVQRELVLADVQWPERTRHGMRVAHLRGGGSLQSSDSAAWDAWSASSGQRDSPVVRLQRSWRGVLASVAALVAIGVAIHQWGLPLASRAIVAAAPLSLDKAIGDASLPTIDRLLMSPSRLPPAEQERLRTALTRALAAQAKGTVPEWQLVFRRSRIGPNAFALPGGTLVMTDQLVELVGADEKVITAVLAHEIGHVRHRHGLRLLVQTTVLSGLAGIVLGDFSTVLAGVPVLLGQASYSREAEREADAEAVRVLKAAGISPAVMITLFDKLAEKRARDSKNKKTGKTDKADKSDKSETAATAAPDEKSAGQSADAAKEGDSAQMPDADSWLGIAFASHPGDAERIRFFREAAGQ